MAGYPLPGQAEQHRIVAASRSGSEEALELLYREYAPALRQFCRQRLSDPTEAEDACHEAILRAHRGLPRFRPEAPLWPWLATIAANVCVDLTRSRLRHGTTEGPAPEGSGAQEQWAPGPEDEVDRRIRARILAEALTSLPDRYREPVYLKHLAGWTYEEIAGHHRTSVSAVRSRLLRGRRALRDRIQELAEGQGHWPLPAVALLRRWTDRVGQWTARPAIPALADALGAAAVAVGALAAGAPTSPPAPPPVVATSVSAAATDTAVATASSSPPPAMRREAAAGYLERPSAAAPDPAVHAARRVVVAEAPPARVAGPAPTGAGTRTALELGPTRVTCGDRPSPLGTVVCPALTPS
jgi:RNA polymerase sigma-70 factor, ECF subfamily